MIIARYPLEIVVEPLVDVSDGDAWYMQEARVKADLPAMLEDLTENLTSLLPEGYSARIARPERRK